MTLDKILECVEIEAETLLQPQTKAVFKKILDPYFEEVSAFKKNLDVYVLELKKEIGKHLKKNTKNKFLDMYNSPGQDYIKCSNHTPSIDAPYLDVYYPETEHGHIWGWIPQKAYKNEPLKLLLSYANWPEPEKQNLTMFQFAIVAILHDAPILENGCNLIYFGSGDDLADRAASEFMEVLYGDKNRKVKTPFARKQIKRVIDRLKNAFDTVKIKLADNVEMAFIPNEINPSKTPAGTGGNNENDIAIKPAGTVQGEDKQVKMTNTLLVDDEYFLLKMAQLVHGWITGDTIKLKRFREQIKAFHKDYQECDREYLRQLKETEKLDGESDEDHRKRTGHIPPPPWESPTDLLELPDCHTSLHVLRVKAIVYDSKEPKQSIPPQKILRASYVHLAILHDKILESDTLVPSISAGIWPEDEPWVVDQWNLMQQERFGSRPIHLNLKLDRAFKSVKKDLEQPAGKGQQASGGSEGDQASKEKNTLKKLIQDILKEFPDTKPKEMTNMVNKKLEAIGRKKTTYGTVKNTMARLKKE